LAFFVINEWLWHDLAGENHALARIQATDMLSALAHSDHTIIIIPHSAFDDKAWGLCSSHDPTTRWLGGIFVRLIRQNSARCMILGEAQILALDPQLARQVKQDDQYLLQACLSQPQATIVTTDKPLQKVLKRNNIPFLSREEFAGLMFRAAD